jgi:hypothetical protein
MIYDKKIIQKLADRIQEINKKVDIEYNVLGNIIDNLKERQEIITKQIYVYQQLSPIYREINKKDNAVYVWQDYFKLAEEEVEKREEKELK